MDEDAGFIFKKTYNRPSAATKQDANFSHGVNRLFGHPSDCLRRSLWIVRDYHLKFDSPGWPAVAFFCHLSEPRATVDPWYQAQTGLGLTPFISVNCIKHR